MKKYVLGLLLLGQFANAGNPVTREVVGVYTLFQSTTNDVEVTAGAFATITVQGSLLSWAVKNIGTTGDVFFDLSHTTGAWATCSTCAAISYVTNVSSPIRVSSGTTLSSDVRGMVMNPRIRIRSLTAPTTVYTTLEYLAPWEK